ncbi:hypothetical protein OAF54_00730 [bacterium]|nr:hypothetical protein [bacterium]
MIEYAATAALAIAIGLWRFWDGSDDRKSGSNYIAIFLAFVAGGVALGGGVLDPLRIGIVVCATLITARVLTKGMSGWSRYMPHEELVDGEIKKRSGMMLGCALYTLAPAGFLYVASGSLSALLWGLSGLVIAAVYVEGSKRLPGSKRFLGMTAEQLGRISYGPLASLCLV